MIERVSSPVMRPTASSQRGNFQKGLEMSPQRRLEQKGGWDGYFSILLVGALVSFFRERRVLFTFVEKYFE